MPQGSLRQKEILIVEDHLPDLKLAKRAITKTLPQLSVRVASHGREALNEIAANGKPDFILLDMMMPIMDGWEFLDALRADENLRRIPVIVLTTSERQVDIDRAYFVGANAYVVKPVLPNGFLGAVQALGDFWTTQVRLPTSGD